MACWTNLGSRHPGKKIRRAGNDRCEGISKLSYFRYKIPGFVFCAIPTRAVDMSWTGGTATSVQPICIAFNGCYSSQTNTTMFIFPFKCVKRVPYLENPRLLHKRINKGVVRNHVRLNALQSLDAIHDLARSVHVAVVSKSSDAAVQECQRRVNAQLSRSLHHSVHILSAVLQSHQSCQRDAVDETQRSTSQGIQG